MLINWFPLDFVTNYRNHPFASVSVGLVLPSPLSKYYQVTGIFCRQDIGRDMGIGTQILRCLNFRFWVVGMEIIIFSWVQHLAEWRSKSSNCNHSNWHRKRWNLNSQFHPPFTRVWNLDQNPESVPVSSSPWIASRFLMPVNACKVACYFC